MYRRDEPSALFHGLHQAHRRRVMEEQARRGLADLGSPMLLIALLHAEQKGERWSQRQVAEQMRLAPATVAAVLKSLERLGYVERQADERDARRNRVSLTDKGRRAVEGCAEGFRSVDERMLSGFTAAETAQLTDFFVRMAENLGGLPECPPPDFRPSEKEDPTA